MSDALLELVYLDWDRARSLAIESRLEPAGLPADWRYGAGASRGLQGAVLRALVEGLGGRVTEVGPGFEYASWAPERFPDGHLVSLSTAEGGTVRLLDYPWLSSVMESLPRTLKVSQRAELSALKTRREQHQITQAEVEQKVKEHQAQLKDLENWKLDELTDVVRELFGQSVRLKVIPGGAVRGEMFVAACPSGHFLEPPALLAQRYGCDVHAAWKVLGIVNAGAAGVPPTPLLPTGNAVEDMFERLALAVNRIHRVASSPDFPALSLTPLAIWRELRRSELPAGGLREGGPVRRVPHQFACSAALRAGRFPDVLAFRN